MAPSALPTLGRDSAASLPLGILINAAVDGFMRLAREPLSVVEAIDLWRDETLAASYRDYSDGFVGGQSRPSALQEAVWINPPRRTP